MRDSGSAQVKPLSGHEIEKFEVGRIVIRVTHGCIYRDIYELRIGQPVPYAVKKMLLRLGKAMGGESIYTVDVPGKHKLTVAAQSGRIMLQPRMGVIRAHQRDSTIDLAIKIDQLMALHTS